MAEIGLILSIASLIKISATVLTECADYISKVKNAPADIDKIINEVSGLEFILKRLSSLASSEPENDVRLVALKGMLMLPSGPFKACEETLTELAKKLQKITGGNVVRRRLIWPFEGGKLEELLKGLERHKNTLRSALHADQIEIEIRTEDSVKKISTQLEDLELNEERKRMAEWLRGADGSTNHNSARKKHEPGTGDWLLKLKVFEEWRDGDEGVLWLYGIPGAGKTVLSSTVVEHVKKIVEGEEGARIAYYYFDFSDHAKQTAHGCVLSLVRQLFTQTIKIPEELQTLYNESRHETPSLDQLTEVLVAILGDGTQSFIVIDALDECKEEEGEQERASFLELLTEIKSSLEGKGGYNIFIASRPEPDIKRELSELGVLEVSMEKALVDEDIRSHLQALLPKVTKFKKWPEPVKKEIEDTLVQQANGMFRWAACQLDALKLCAKPANALRQLHSLPKTLEDTYSRILQRVPPDNEREMKSILMLLAFSARPVTIQEVAEATAVVLEKQKFCIEERFGEALDILELCSSLVSLAEPGAEQVLRKEMRFRQLGSEVRIVTFAHFSVKEYIVSDLVQKSTAKMFYVNEALCQEALTEMCLIYILDFNDGKRVVDISHDESPFLAYAALHWTTHLTLVPEKERQKSTELLIRLFDPNNSDSLMNYLNIYNPVSSMNAREYDRTATRTLNMGPALRNKRDFETPLYYACYYGIIPVVDALLGKNASHSISPEQLGSALEAAASHGQDEIITRLLKEGADPNARYCPQYFRPIQAAARSGSVSAVKLLIAAGADISPKSYGGEWGTALHVVASQGSAEVTQALIDAGHELDYIVVVNYHHGTALAVATAKGKDEVVACLLRNGADPTLFTYWHNYPLSLACENCSLESVKLLLDAGADVQGDGSHTALHEAGVRGDIPILKLLLDRGADINRPGGVYGTPLKAAIQSRDISVFEFMLEHGANMNGRGSSTNLPVDQAIFGGNIKAADRLLELGAEFSDEALAEALDYSTKEYLVKELLKRGANPNAEHERHGNMLQLALEKRCEKQTIEWLLEEGADVNAVEGEYGTALQAAIVQDAGEEIIRMLFDHGAKCNLPVCGTMGNPLQAAIIHKSEPNIQLLLDRGADVNAVGGTYGTALQAAAYTGNEALVKTLLENGVEVDILGGEYGTALRAAIAMQHESIVKLLLEARADPDIRTYAHHSSKSNSWTNQETNSAIEVAAGECNTSIFQLLLDHGMQLSPDLLKDVFANAVRHAAEERLKMIEFLISKGADLKKYGGLALFYASGWNRTVDIAKGLISLGAPLDYSLTGTHGSALMHAIYQGNEPIIQLLLDAGADINLGAGESGTALITAIDKGNTELALNLLDRGADPNIKAGRWGTALTTAVNKGDEDMFYELLKRGAEINDNYGYRGTPLQAAISRDYWHLANELLDRGADPNAPGLYASPLVCATGYGKAGQVELIKRLLNCGVDLEVFDVKRPEDSDVLANRYIFNALQHSTYAGNDDITKLLLDAGANINAVGGTYGTALIAAIKEQQDSTVTLLLERGADVNLVCESEHGTALHAAAAGGRVAIVELLLKRGADVNTLGGKYGTALQAACQTSKSKIVEQILARGAKVNTDCGEYGNPLQAAAQSGYLQHIKTLLEHGADINHPGGQYGFALQASACSHRCDPGDLELMQYLLDNGAEVNAVGGEYGTALQAAAYHHKPYVELLLKHGADPRIEGGKYGSATGAAEEKKFNRVVKMLREWISEKEEGK